MLVKNLEKLALWSRRFPAVSGPALLFFSSPAQKKYFGGNEWAGPPIGKMKKKRKKVRAHDDALIHGMSSEQYRWMMAKDFFVNINEYCARMFIPGDDLKANETVI